MAQVPDEVQRLGSQRVLLVSGGPEAVYADELATLLGDSLKGRFTDVVMHVPVQTADAAVTAAERAGADLVVALGGRSVRPKQLH